MNALMRSSVAALVALASLVSAVQAADEKDEKEKAMRKKVQDALQSLADGKGEWKKLSVTYNDLHPLHGGLTLTIHGTGKVEQKAVREKAGTAKDVTPEELAKLVEMLRKHQAWEQKVPDRAAAPDESKARLTIKYGDDSVVIWEWFNDLKKNDRLIQIKEGMKSLAWKKE